MRADIAKWIVAQRNRPAAKTYDIPATTIPEFIKSYKENHFGDETLLETIPRKKRCCHELLREEINKKVNNLVKEMQSAGAAMLHGIVTGITKSIVCENDLTLFKKKRWKD